MRERTPARAAGRVFRRPTRNQVRIAVFALAMLTLIVAGSVPRQG